MHTKCRFESIRGRDDLREVPVDESILLKRILEKNVQQVWMVTSDVQ
jgi:hypothetical protein